MKIRRSRKVIAAAAVIGLLSAGGALAYWTFGGGGTGSAKTADTTALVVTQTIPAPTLAPGGSVALAGTITNSNTTDVKVGTLTAEITGASNSGVALGDFTLTGNPVTVNAVVKKGTPLAWTGMTLSYANSDVNQDNAKNTTVSIKYTLTPFTENVVVPLGTKTVTTVNGLRTVTIKIDKIGTTPLVAGTQVNMWLPAVPNGWACAGTTTDFCNLTAPAPTVNIYGQITGNNTNPVNPTLGKVDAAGVYTFVGPMTSAVQWQFGSAAASFTL